jgi:hypothetical protein
MFTFNTKFVFGLYLIIINEGGKGYSKVVGGGGGA